VLLHFFTPSHLSEESHKKSNWDRHSPYEKV
jgi:hypothetical protein